MESEEEKKTRILENLKHKYEYAASSGDRKPIAIFLHGSQNYGLDLETDDYHSDVDAILATMPTLKQLALQKTMDTTTLVLPENEEHIDVKDIRLLKDMIIKQNISYVQILFTKHWFATKEYEPLIRELLSKRDKLAHICECDMMRCVLGMGCEKNVHLLPDKAPEGRQAICEKFGYDPKQYHHIVRLTHFAEDFFLKGIPFEKAIRPEPAVRNMLIDLKLGKDSAENAKAASDECIEKMRTIYKTKFNDGKARVVDEETIAWLEDWTVRIFREGLRLQLNERNPENETQE